MLAFEFQTGAHILQEAFPEHVVVSTLVNENVVKEIIAYLPR